MTLNSISNTYIKIGNTELRDSTLSQILSLTALYNDPIHKTQESVKALEIKGEDISSNSNWYVFIPQGEIEALKLYFKNESAFQDPSMQQHTQEALRALEKMSLYWESQKDSKEKQGNFKESLPIYKDYEDYSNAIKKEGYNILRKYPDGLYEIKLGSFHILSTTIGFAYGDKAASTDSKDLLVNLSQTIPNTIQESFLTSSKSSSDSIMQSLFEYAKDKDSNGKRN